MTRCLCQHTRCLNNRAVQRQLGSVRRKRRIEPWRVEIEQRNDENK
jgi:hypothetical protein